jgi:hypothetical protein
MIRTRTILSMATLFTLGIGIWFTPGIATAHCDTFDGPVVTTARMALEKGDVTPVLKWVRKDDEAGIKDIFNKTLIVRGKGKEAKELADMYFFETLVRIHRAGEGAPYTGLKPAGQVEPSVAAADKALETGSADGLVKLVNDAAAAGIREHFAKVKEAKKHADESVDKGREYVAAYVAFTHYVERLHADATVKCECEHHREHHGEIMEMKEMKHEDMGAGHMHEH